MNKSAILFLCSAFEAFVEDLASAAFEYIVSNTPSPEKLPTPIRRSIAESLRTDKNELKVWELAADGWKSVAAAHKSRIVDKYVGHFNTPKYGNIENLLSELLGFNGTEESFKWRSMPAKTSKEKLREFVELRGALAHGEKPAPSVRKEQVIKYLNLLAPLSVRLSNEVSNHIEKQIGKRPWQEAEYGSIY